MKKTILFFALLFFAVAGFAQVRPDQQTTKTPADTDAIYTQEDGSLKKVLFGTFKQYVIDGTLDSLILIQDSILIAFNGAGTEIFRDTIAVGSINTDNQTIDTLQLNGTILEISLEGDGEGLQTVNLASLQDGTGTDDQTIDTLQLNGTTLEISLEGDGQALQTVNLSSLQDGTGTDNQTLDVSQLNGTTLELSLSGDGEATKEIDLSSLQISEISNHPNLLYFKKLIESGQKINIVLIGDSKSLGRTTGWFSSYMRTEYGNGGIGYSAPGTTPASGIWFTYPSSYTLLDLADEGLKSLSGHALKIETIADEYRVYSFKGAEVIHDSLTYFDAIDFWTLDTPNGGEFEIIVDGVPYDTIDTNNGTITKTKHSITGLSFGSHDVRWKLLTNPGAGGTLTDIIFKRANDYGVTIHKIANAGSQSSNFNTLFLDADNNNLFNDINPNLLIVRFGTNEMAANVVPSTFNSNINQLIDTLKNYNDTLSVFLCGLEDLNQSGTYTEINYSDELANISKEKGYGFFNLFGKINNWTQFDLLGFASDNIHENTEGGREIAYFLFNHFQKDFDNYGAYSAAGNTILGTANEITFFDSNSSISSVTGVSYDGETVKFSGNGANNIEFGGNNWANINTIAGTTDFTFWSEYDSNDSRYESTDGTAYPTRWRSTTTLPIEISKANQTGVGNQVSYSRILYMSGANNSITLPAYSTGSSITGTTSNYAVFNAAGTLIPRSLADLKSELDLTKTAYSIPFVDGSGAIQTNSISNSVVGGFGTYSGGNWWFNFSNNLGYLELNHFSKLASAGIHVSTAGVRASRWARDGSRSFIIESTPTTPSTGDTLTFTRDFEIWATTGKVIFNRYTSSSSITGTTNHFITQSSDGSILTRSDSEMRTDLKLAPLSGSGVPAVTPRYNGDRYFDYTNSIWYSAWDNENLDGTGDGLDADDWVALN